jgi:hypothetical protein
MQIFCLIYMMRKASQHKNSHSNMLMSHCWFSCSSQYQITSAMSTFLEWQLIWSHCLIMLLLTYLSLHFHTAASSVRWNCDRIYSFMNYLIRCWVSAIILIRALIFSWSVTESFSMYLISANLEQWTMMWVTVSHAWSHWHVSNS